ncbi:RdgB/HAM1 family non-canonical purine NTP pyrophosphatase [Patescibacteria group bacterium]|nr:RdgB/HAM1 family non-canonical purine NTP pyrophosphatase [Patescibacteria group bacterium]
MNKIMLATQNKDKLKEFQALLRPFHFHPIPPPKKLPVLETGNTFRANALLKAKAYGRFFGLPVIADDSGLCIDYLNGRPGINSHRFALNGFPAARQKILKLMQHLPQSQRTAQFVCCLAYFNPQTKNCRIFTGKTKGFIAGKEIGRNGFGYDPIFFCPDLNKTFGEASSAQKNQFSHRAKALKKLLTFLKQSAVPK